MILFYFGANRALHRAGRYIAGNLLTRYFQAGAQGDDVHHQALYDPSDLEGLSTLHKAGEVTMWHGRNIEQNNI